MPPWPASPHGVALLGSKRLDQTSIDTILEWSAAGGPLDVPADHEDHADGRSAGAGAAPATPCCGCREAYAGSLSVPNDYRCFVLNPHLTKPTFLTGYQVTPDHRAEIHHVQIFHIDKSQVDGREDDLRAATASPVGVATARSSLPVDAARSGAAPPARLHRSARSHRRLGARPGPGRVSRSTPGSCCSPATRSCCRCTTTTTRRRFPIARTVVDPARPGHRRTSRRSTSSTRSARSRSRACPA